MGRVAIAVGTGALVGCGASSAGPSSPTPVAMGAVRVSVAMEPGCGPPKETPPAPQICDPVVAPEAGIQVHVRRPDGGVIAHGTTDADGTVTLEVPIGPAEVLAGTAHQTVTIASGATETVRLTDTSRGVP